MGQKVNPVGFRVGIVNKWKNIWYAESHYAEYFLEDVRIKQYLMNHVNEKKDASISNVTIERKPGRITVNTYTARPAVIIGKKGAEVDVLRKALQKMTKNKVEMKIIQVKRPETNAKLVAMSISAQLKRRMPFRRAMKMAISKAMQNGALGVRIRCSGRLGGAEMSRSEEYREGRVPLHTLRAAIDYGYDKCKTTFGIIGVKVWIFHGEVFGPPGSEPVINAKRI